MCKISKIIKANYKKNRLTSYYWTEHLYPIPDFSGLHVWKNTS